jgi:peroxiredoxin
LLLLALATCAAAAGQGLSEVPGWPAAEDFELADLQGHRHRLADSRGRVLVLAFWASWCIPCREELPSLQRAAAQLRDRDVVILGVNLGEDPETVRRFAQQQALSLPLLLDTESRVATAWQVRGLPTAFVVDRDGRVVLRANGARRWDDPELLRTLLAVTALAAGR